MKRWIFIEALIYAILFWTAASAHAQTPLGSSRDPAQAQTETIKGSVDQLMTEIKMLKYELKTLQLEQQRMRVVPLERELAQVMARRQRLEAQETTMSQEMAQLEQHLSEAPLSLEERKELETSRSEPAGGELERVRQDKQAAVQREAEVIQWLGQERQRWQELSENAKTAWTEMQSFAGKTQGKDNE
jgi:chromosome segregation ATPase